MIRWLVWKWFKLWNYYCLKHKRNFWGTNYCPDCDQEERVKVRQQKHKLTDWYHKVK